MDFSLPNQLIVQKAETEKIVNYPGFPSTTSNTSEQDQQLVNSQNKQEYFVKNGRLFVYDNVTTYSIDVTDLR